MQQTPNPKCSNCRCYWKPAETDIKSSGLQYKTCTKCRNKKYEHLMDTYEAIKSREQYYKNREFLREKIVCACGSTICRDGMKKHVKTYTHTINT